MEGGGNAWTTFVKKWSVDNKTPYLCAISTPEVSAAYRATKKAKKEEVKNTTFQSLKEQAIALASVGLAPKKPRGRPKKYATAAEAKAAKTAKTIESNKKSYAKKTEAKTKGKVGRPERRVVIREVRDADEDVVSRVVAEAEAKRKEDETKRKEAEKEAEAKRKADDEKILLTPAEAKQKLNATPPSRWAFITNKFIVGYPKYENGEYKDPYGYDLAKVPNFKYFLPDKAYITYSDDKLIIDPDTLQPLGKLKETGRIGGSPFVFNLTELGEQRLKQYKSESEFEEYFKQKPMSDKEVDKIIADWAKKEGRNPWADADRIARYYAARSITGEDSRDLLIRKFLKK